MTNQSNTRAAFTLLTVFCTGCGSFRGLPSHGGGKRFDEEQRVVSGCIRKSVAEMDIDTLKGKRVRLIINSIAHNGSADVRWPGLSSFGVGGFRNQTLYNNARDLYREYGDKPEADVWRPQYRDDNELNARGMNMNLRVNPQMHYSTDHSRTDRDMQYLKAALEMKLHHAGVLVVGDKPEVVLYVLVDVIGTNLSRTHKLVYFTDDLVGSCELSYYALNAKNQGLLFAARRAGAQAKYSETGVLGISGLFVEREVKPMQPVHPAIDRPGPNPLGSAGAAANGGTNGTSQVYLPPEIPDDDTQKKPDQNRNGNGAKQPDSDAVKGIIRHVEAQIQLGRDREARAFLEALRAVDPNHPSIHELDARIGK